MGVGRGPGEGRERGRGQDGCGARRGAGCHGGLLLPPELRRLPGAILVPPAAGQDLLEQPLLPLRAPGLPTGPTGRRPLRVGTATAAGTATPGAPRVLVSPVGWHMFMVSSMGSDRSWCPSWHWVPMGWHKDPPLHRCPHGSVSPTGGTGPGVSHMVAQALVSPMEWHRSMVSSMGQHRP